MYYHVPKKMAEQLSMDDWLNAMKQGIGGEVIERSEEFLKYQAPQNSEKVRCALAWKCCGVCVCVCVCSEKVFVVILQQLACVLLSWNTCA